MLGDNNPHILLWSPKEPKASSRNLRMVPNSWSDASILNSSCIHIYGYGKIFRSHLFGYPTIVSCDAEFNMFVLRNEGHLFATGYPRNIPEVLGDLTLLHLTGEAHKRLRGVALSFFATVKTESEHFLADIEAGALGIINPWKDKETLHFCDEARKFTFNVIVKQILSLRPDDHEATEILQKFHSFMEGLISMPINLPGTPYAKAIKARLEIEDIARVLLHARRKVQTVDANRRTDFLDVLLTYEELSEEEIVSMVMGLLLGGYETTASLLAIIVKFLGDDPKVLNELQKEHQKVLEKKKDEGGGLRWEDYQCMTFTQNVINEALRLGNVVKFVHRRTIQPIQYKATASDVVGERQRVRTVSDLSRCERRGWREA
ncbi:hypothetical protein QJS10_CPB22g00346 [Acorus calamus]|uniref:Cytochrome P450 n=1 Tax=Acorus calamus TaxID=4465 RepID=A0AAV9C1Y8_ACOCL|nr:hypothetical protein QJS10_CPB22g00346 [Acorus calamus]